MNNAAFSIKAFAGYLFALGAVLLIAPNVLLALTAFALLGLANPMLALFGAMDLAGALWTIAALKKAA
ncbi:MAG: hypothetical protein EFKGCFLK_01375 [Rhodocyclaceae bacterium]|nr:MAG: hypothetical protein F9K21_05665 [Rhodocyclaceae bacterium]MBV6407807.1 hypothetical protein [Rhodocyclaceae bacterium]CAG0941315.1 hypothetical protein GPROT2_01260 [Gammaproteobacteria bacterium]